MEVINGADNRDLNNDSLARPSPSMLEEKPEGEERIREFPLLD